MVYEKIAEILRTNNNYLIVADNDPDGVCSALLLKVILKKLNKDFKIKLRSVRNYHKLESNIIGNSKYNTIVFLDTPFRDDDLIRFAKNNKEKLISYTDHHKREIPKDIPENLKYFDIRALNLEVTSTTAVVYKVGRHIFGTDFKRYSLLALIGSMCDWMTDNDTLRDFKEAYKGVYTDDYDNLTYIIVYPLFFFTFGDMSQLIKIGDLLVDDPRKFIERLELDNILNTAKKQIECVKRSKVVYESEILIVFEVKENVSIVANILSTFYPEKIVMVYSPIKERFLDRLFPRKCKASIRSRKNYIDLGKIVQEFVKEHGINGGGHPKAAGVGLWKKDLKKFIEFLEASVEREALH